MWVKYEKHLLVAIRVYAKFITLRDQNPAEGEILRGDPNMLLAISLLETYANFLSRAGKGLRSRKQ